MMEKFRFETSFDHLSSSPASEPSEQKERTVTFSEAELNSAREEGYSAGLQAGIEQQQRTRDQSLAQILTEIGQAISTIEQSLTNIRDAANRHAIEVGVAITRKIAPELINRNGVAEVEGLIGHCLPDLINEPRVVVRIPNEILQDLQGHVDRIAGECGYAGRIILIVDDSLHEADCRIEWADGGAAHETAVLWQQVDEAVSRVLTMPNEMARIVPDAETHNAESDSPIESAS